MKRIFILLFVIANVFATTWYWNYDAMKSQFREDTIGLLYVDTVNIVRSLSASRVTTDSSLSAESLKVTTFVLGSNQVLWTTFADTSKAYAHDTADVLRAAFRDTSTVVWNDSLPSALGYVHDTADVVRGEVRDTINSWWGDTSAVYGHLSELSDTADVLRAAFRDTSTVVWNDSIADIRADVTLAIVTVTDSLFIPLVNNHPNTANVGFLCLDTTGTDTLWINTQNGWLVVAHD